MILCSICAAKIQKNIPNKKLQIDKSTPGKNQACAECQNIRYCYTYKIADKPAD